MPPKVAVFSALSPQQKEVFYQYFLENDTKFSYNPKSNTYIAEEQFCWSPGQRI